MLFLLKNTLAILIHPDRTLAQQGSYEKIVTTYRSPHILAGIRRCLIAQQISDMIALPNHYLKVHKHVEFLFIKRPARQIK
jgi:hypothetical protein